MRDGSTGLRATLTNRAFGVHYLQMVAAMGIGMVVLEPLAMSMAMSAAMPMPMHAVHHAGTEVEFLLMATTMAAGMAAWMAYRRHTGPAIVEMCGAMYVSVAVLFPFSWLDVVSRTGLMILAHLLMLIGMAVAMLHRRENYL